METSRRFPIPYRLRDRDLSSGRKLAFGILRGIAWSRPSQFRTVKAHELYNAVDPALVTQMLDWFRDNDRNVYKSAVATLEMAPVVKLSGSTSEESLVVRLKAWFQRMSDVPAAIDSILKSASDWADKMIRLVALFAVQTIVLPLGFLWLFWRICKLTISALAPAGVLKD